jgi:hypothetical protein
MSRTTIKPLIEKSIPLKSPDFKKRLMFLYVAIIFSFTIESVKYLFFNTEYLETSQRRRE